MELVVDKNLITFGSVLISVKGYMNTKIRYKILKLIDAVILWESLMLPLFMEAL